MRVSSNKEGSDSPELGPPPISEQIVLNYNKALLGNTEQLATLELTCGISAATVTRFNLGWSGDRYTWPVYDSHGLVRNIRMYKYGDKSGSKVIHYSMVKDGQKITYGTKNTRLFPIRALDTSPSVVLLCEGEKDSLNANQAGYNAVSVTGGAGQWQPEFCNGPLRGKHVVICYDVDMAGRQAARKIQQMLRLIAASVHIFEIPREGLPEHGDLTDWLMLRPDESRLVLDAFITNVLSGSSDSNPIQLMSLGDTKRPQYNNKRIAVDAHVVGKETRPYTADRGYNLVCPMSRGKVCDSCGLGGSVEGESTIIIPSDAKNILYTIERTDPQVKSFIAEQAGIIKCPLWTAEPMPEQRSSVEKILLSTTIDQRNYDGSAEYIQQMAYVVDAPITSNAVYKFEGRMTTHPKDQSNTFIITGASTSKMSIDTYDSTPERHESLQFFQPESNSPKDILARLEMRWEDLSANVTNIYQRTPLHIITDLVAHSLLRFKLFGKIPDRCWLEGYIGGDTRQGKSEVAKRLHNHYKAGELVIAENASLSGILGGAQKLPNGEWMVSWGKCPLNDRGWVTFDECQNISLTIMGALSGMRSSGVAEIDKIRVERVQARTRILWLSNPRSDGLNVDQLAHGIQLVPDVFGRPEDVARLDLVSIVRSRDVGTDVLRSQKPFPHKHTSDLCHTLIMFAWSRTSSDIIFTEEAAEVCMSAAERLTECYSCDIKVVERMEQRVKLARIAGAVAAMCYSSPDGHSLVILPEHAQVAEMLVHKLFDDPAVSYQEYAEYFQARETVRSKGVVTDWCKKQNRELLDALLQQQEMRLFDLQNYANLDRDRAQTLMSFLVVERAMTLRSGTYAKSREFVAILRQALVKGWHLKEGEKSGSTDTSDSVDY